MDSIVNVIKSPALVHPNVNIRYVFLAGSIEMGLAENWQDKLIRKMKFEFFPKTIVLNSRRDDWDSSWKQDYNDPKFYEQVNWELDMLDMCDIIVMYFDPATKSPVSLLELGLHAKSGKLLVVCPDGFWKKGNVEIVCRRHGIPMYTNMDVLMRELKNRLWRKTNSLY
jgi:hypothetical protein